MVHYQIIMEERVIIVEAIFNAWLILKNGGAEMNLPIQPVHKASPFVSKSQSCVILLFSNQLQVRKKRKIFLKRKSNKKA